MKQYFLAIAAALAICVLLAPLWTQPVYGGIIDRGWRLDIETSEADEAISYSFVADTHMYLREVYLEATENTGTLLVAITRVDNSDAAVAVFADEPAAEGFNAILAPQAKGYFVKKGDTVTATYPETGTENILQIVYEHLKN